MSSSTPGARKPTSAAKNAARDPAASAISGFPPALVRTTLDRVLESATFRRSPRHRLFLGHLVRTTLEGGTERLKEVILGVEIFDRKLASYDPRRDPIVRVEAGRVREKLDRYYATEGAEDAFQIDIPVGAYVPQFKRRTIGGPLARPLGSLAVLPVVNLSGHADDASFCVGMTDELIDTLGRVPGLQVVARVSAFKARESARDLREIGKLLAVETVVESSIQRSGQRVRCIVQLSRTRDGVRLWSRRFEHDADGAEDLFGFQDEISEAVLAAVAPLLAEAQARKNGGATDAPTRPVSSSKRAARDLFERGRYLAQQRTMEGYSKSIKLFQRAVEADPEFIQALVFLAVSHANLAAFVFERGAPHMQEVGRLARRALVLDPGNGEAQSLMATITYRYDFDWRRAEPMFLGALRAAPNSTIVHTSYAWALSFNGRFEEARRHVQMTHGLDPLNLGLRANNALILAYCRDYERAQAEFLAVLDLDPDHLFSKVMLGMCYLFQQKTDPAMPLFDAVIGAFPEHPSAHFCRICVLGMRGEILHGREQLDALLARLEDRYFSKFNLAMAHASLGDHEAVFWSLEEAGKERDILFASLPAHRSFDVYHGDPRYLSLLARHGLEQFAEP